MYTKSSRFYDALFSSKVYASETEWLLKSFREASPESRSLLDVACGTGRHMELLRPHYEVEGIDLNAEMIAIARRKLPEDRLHVGDMRDFNLGRTFGIVACLFGSIVYSQTVEGLNQTIAAMARHVSPGGLLAVEPFFPPERYWTGHLVLNTSATDGMKLAWGYVMQRRGQTGILDIHYMVIEASGVSTFNEIHELGLFTDEDYQQAFAAAGFASTHDPAGPSGRGMYFARRG